MDTTIWSFLIIVVVASIVGYHFLKRYSSHYAKKRTDKIIHQFMKKNQITTEIKSLEEVEAELFAQEEKYELENSKKKKKKKNKNINKKSKDKNKDKNKDKSKDKKKKNKKNEKSEKKKTKSNEKKV
jgi:hypothetical protein